MRCEFTIEVQEGFFRCEKCGAIGVASLTMQCGSVPTYDARKVELFDDIGRIKGAEVRAKELKKAERVAWPDGPGTRTRALLHAMGFPACQLCSQTAKKMNDAGDDWCRQNIDDLVTEMAGNAQQNPELSARLKSLTKMGTTQTAMGQLLRTSIKGGMVYNAALTLARTIANRQPARIT